MITYIVLVLVRTEPEISSRYREELIFKLKQSKVMFMVCCHGRHVGGACGQLKVEAKLFLGFVFVFVDWSGSKLQANSE